MKICTVIVSLGKQMLRYRSISDVPDDIRDKVNEAISGPYAGTILIADEAGRREIARMSRERGTPVLDQFEEGGTALLDQFEEQEIKRNRWNG
jgi:hypothetical protein